MNDTDRSTVHAWLLSKRVTKCPACGGIELKATDVAGSLLARVFPNKDGNPGSPQSYAVDQPREDHAVQVLVECGSCAHVMHFDARAVGLSVFQG